VPPRVLVKEKIGEPGVARLREAGLEVDLGLDWSDGELAERIGAYEGILIRSATKLTVDLIERAGRLRVIGRAGVGVDNVDVPAATKRGIVVANAPQSNVVTAAEHTMALLLALARNIPQADASLRAGRWERSRFSGVELYDKTLGIVGFGRIGQLVAERLKGFGVEILAYDPYVSVQRAGVLGARLVTLDELLAESDFITVHLPKTSETIGLIGDRELRLVKPSVRFVNAARGGLIDEDALDLALKEKRVAGAAIDVFATEPCTDSPLFHHDNVVVTPHLGASTHEAQEKAGTQVARSVRLALSGEFVPDAVNVQGGGVVAEDVKPGLPLTEKLGRIFTALAGGVPARLEVEVRGEITEHDVKVLELAALKGAFTDVVEESVTYVNAPLLSRDRGVEVTLTTTEDSADWRNLITVRGTMADGAVVSVSGTLTGPRHAERLVEVNGYAMEIAPTAHMGFFTYTDRPGIVGVVGRLLGDAGINIAGMQVGRHKKGGKALIALTVDSALGPDLTDAIAAEIGAEQGRRVDLED
jgi:D-3-phosphoglycerate dehydrogenase